ncbi:MAG: hypothetical protein RSD41_04110 [Kiritimatiellia bacterium]
MRFFLPVLLLALLIVAPGCIWTRGKINDVAVRTRTANIVLGQTRADTLPKLFGTMPTAIIPLKDGRVVYSFAYGDAKTEGFSLILVTFTKTNSYFSAVYALADANGIVQAVHSAPQQEVEWETWPFGD